MHLTNHVVISHVSVTTVGYVNFTPITIHLEKIMLSMFSFIRFFNCSIQYWNIVKCIITHKNIFSYYYYI